MSPDAARRARPPFRRAAYRVHELQSPDSVVVVSLHFDVDFLEAGDRTIGRWLS